MNAGSLIVPPSISVVIVDDCNIISIISTMVNHSISSHVVTRRSIVESDNHKGDYYQYEHHSQAAKPSNAVEALGGPSLSVNFR